MKLETGRRLAYLDGWRGIAILAVLIGHFWTDSVYPGLSTLGVDLFFVLSGRLMADILFVQQSPLKTFFVRRFSRVYPALLVFVIVTTVAFAFSPYRHGIAAALSALTFTINYGMIYGHPVGLLDHLWSLCVEEHGYVVLALVALTVRRNYRAAIFTLSVLGVTALVNGIVQDAVTGHWFTQISWRTDVQVAPLFIAGALYLIARNVRVLRQPWISPACFVLGITAKLIGSSVAVRFGFGTLMLALSIATVDHAVLGAKRTLERAPLCQIGLWSFSLYLWQQPFYKLAHDEVMPSPLLFTAAISAGLLSFYLVEGPARRFINKHWARIYRAAPSFESISAASPSRP